MGSPQGFQRGVACWDSDTEIYVFGSITWERKISMTIIHYLCVHKIFTALKGYQLAPQD